MIGRFLFILLFFSCFAAKAQQIPQYSQWAIHQLALNPAHAGIKKCIDVHSLYRLQWVGFKGAPKSGFLTVSVPIQTRRKRFMQTRHGLGLKFENDRIGNFSFNRINAAYAAHFNFTQDRRISFGLYGGVIQMGYNPGTTTTHDPDPSVMKQASFIAPDASFGAWFNDKNYYIGLSLRNLFPTRWENIGESARYRFHTSLNGAYRWGVSEHLTLLPAAILRIPPSGPVSFDINLHLDYNNLLGFGVGYRNTDALIGFVSLKIKEQFALTYSFDYTLSKIQLGAKNTHELSLRIYTCKPRSTGTTNCPLFE